jgi:hypothetical protein
MKWKLKLETFARWPGLLSAVVIGWLLAGCATSERTAQPKPGKGIDEYRRIARDAQQSVAATVASLEALARPHNDPSKPHPELARFDRALRDLELTSVKARARAEAIIARGEGYFDEWKANLAAASNQPTARVESERYSRLLEHFARIRERSGDVRTEFRPFMMKLREFRATLDTAPTAAGSESSRVTIGLITASGRRVLEALRAVTRSLDEAEVELQASLASKP